MVQKWSFEYYKGFDVQKTNVTSYIHKNNSIHFNYCIDVLILSTECVKELGRHAVQ
jgi:hypothetical protein